MLRQIITPIGPSIAYVPLTQDQFACIDVADIPLVDGRNWFADKDTTTGKFYAKCYLPGQIRVRMHEFILGKREGYTVDHANCDMTLHNRRANLRYATKMQQAYNRGLRKDSTSGLKGARWNKVWKRWQSSIRADGKVHWLGWHATAESAHAAYCAAAKRLHGDFSRIS